MRRIAHISSTLLVVAVILLVARPVSSQVTVTTTDMGALNGGGCVAMDINNLGQAVGHCIFWGTDQARAFVWTSEGGLQDLGTLGGTSSGAALINDLGQVVGASTTASGEVHNFLWTAADGMRDLGYLGLVFDLNNQGQVVGQAYDVGIGYAFLWSEATGKRNLGTLGGVHSQANAVNELGQVVGGSHTAAGDWHSFFWSEGTGMVDLGTLGGSTTNVSDINDLGQVVGESYTTAGEWHAYLWTRDSGMQDLHSWSGGTSFAHAINNQGQILITSSSAGLFLRTAQGQLLPIVDPIGRSPSLNSLNDLGHVIGRHQSLADNHYYGFLWTQETGTLQLDGLGFIGGEARSINNQGQIVGQGVTGTGDWHAALWTYRLVPPTPVEQVESILNDVDDLIDAGVLDPGHATSFIQKLDNIEKLLDKGNTKAACNLLGAFVNQVEAAIHAGQLTVDQGQPLIDAASSLIDQLCG
jgi:probable HAF family extracellular repeat protein